jgi:transposase-like protein
MHILMNTGSDSSLKHASTDKNSGNSRNGGHKKTISGDFDHLDITTLRDRNSTFEAS